MSEGAVRSVAGNLTAAGCRLGTRMTLARTKILKGAFVMADQSHPQTQTSTSPTTGVFALLKAKPGVTRERVMAIMPAEIRATVQLYLEGKIREWYSREDGRGGIFFLNTRDCRRGEIDHGIVAARQRGHAGSRIHSGRSADAVTPANGEPVSQAITQQALNTRRRGAKNLITRRLDVQVVVNERPRENR